MIKTFTLRPVTPRHAMAWITLLCAMGGPMAAGAQDKQAAPGLRELKHPEPVTAAIDTQATDAITARSWLQAQSGGTMASQNKQTLNGPTMSRIYQRFLKQMSGKGGGSSDAGTSSNKDSEAKDNPADDLTKALSGTKP